MLGDGMQLDNLFRGKWRGRGLDEGEEVSTSLFLFPFPWLLFCCSFDFLFSVFLSFVSYLLLAVYVYMYL